MNHAQRSVRGVIRLLQAWCPLVFYRCPGLDHPRLPKWLTNLLLYTAVGTTEHFAAHFSLKSVQLPRDDEYELFFVLFGWSRWVELLLLLERISWAFSWRCSPCFLYIMYYSMIVAPLHLVRWVEVTSLGLFKEMVSQGWVGGRSYVSLLFGQSVIQLNVQIQCILIV